MTTLKMKILLYLLQRENNDCSMTHIAQLFGVNKSSVSRAMKWFEEHNMIEKKGRRIEVTFYGQKEGNLIRSKRNIILEWLLMNGKTAALAKEEALELVSIFSDETIMGLKDHLQKYKLRQLFMHHQRLSGYQIQSQLEESDYSFSFTVYKTDKSDMLQLSMANEALEHPLRVHIANGKGTVYLKTKMMKKKNFTGKMQSLKYWDGHSYLEAGRDDDLFFFPLSVIEFTGISDENLIQGQLKIKMKSTVGMLHMPESEALLVIYI